MAVLTTSPIGSFSALHTFTKSGATIENPGFRLSNFAVQSQVPNRKVKVEAVESGLWRRKKLTKKDDETKYRLEEVPFLEEHMRKIKEDGGLLAMDIDRLLLSEENRFAFVNEIAAEAKEYVENNRDEYGGSKKAILHVISNRMNEAGFDRPEAYIEPDPFKPGPSFLRDDL
ncbi:unnamed protein product [Cuscuta epithymum]|uniref:Protein PLASTID TRANSCRIPTIONALLY ACTIVE 7-like n=1 Tax=Cuscuta epithymum TaxID=186058 RepID=A0AAV0EHY6_9ASTE|nr:unnamed protein product [Cuscuta epithymum]